MPQSYQREEETKIITIAKASPRTTSSGKTYILVEDTQGTLYSIWDNKVPLPELGATYSTLYSIKGQYKSIESMIKKEDKTSEEAEVKANDRNAQIMRQHSQEMSLRYLIAQGGTFSIEQVFQMADRFDEDASKAMGAPF